jgi:hypothetical protein
MTWESPLQPTPPSDATAADLAAMVCQSTKQVLHLLGSADGEWDAAMPRAGSALADLGEFLRTAAQRLPPDARAEAEDVAGALDALAERLRRLGDA